MAAKKNKPWIIESAPKSSSHPVVGDWRRFGKHEFSTKGEAEYRISYFWPTATTVYRATKRKA